MITTYRKAVIKQDEIDRYLNNGEDFINEKLIEKQLKEAHSPDKSYIREIIDKARRIERLNPEETAALINTKDEDLWNEIYKAAGEIKKTVYDNRIVTFAPLYCSNLCVNNCLYCGFRSENCEEQRRILDHVEIRAETEGLIQLGHKRLIMVYGEHPRSDAKYIAETMKTVYDTSCKIRGRENKIRRVNINAAPQSISDLELIHDAGIGTFQVFQETYHHGMYAKYHPSTVKANYRWRLYALHRAFDAGIDDVGAGALFGLYDWRFEVMGLVYHAIDLENRFGIGPHTVSFPRLNPASGIKVAEDNPYNVSDEDFKKLVAVIRLSIPYAGMIITARETKEIRDEIIPIGCTQTDASTRIGVGDYSKSNSEQESDRQQFMLGDTRSLDELIGDLAAQGVITSFCTAGYRCGRTGDKIMRLLKTGEEGKFCKLNAVLTYREWLDDFGSEESRKQGIELIKKEFEEISKDEFYRQKSLVPVVTRLYERIVNGERDLYI